MIVAILYGRSWQGVLEATRILGNAAFASQLQVQDFVEAQNKSLPVLGLVKMDKVAIESRQFEASDYLLLFDTKMDLGILKQAREKSFVIFNSRERITNPLLKKKKLKAFFVDATGIAMSATLKPEPHMAMLGAFTKIFGKIPAKNMKAQLNRKEDALAFEEGFKRVKRN